MPRLIQEGHGLVPSLAAEGVMGQTVDVLGEAVRIEPFDRIDDAGVESATLILEKARIRNLVCERMLEAVLEVGEERRFVQELAALEPTEPTAQVGVRCLIDGLQEGEGDILANDRGGLEEPLVVGWEPVDASTQDGLHRRRHLEGAETSPRPVRAAFTDEGLRLDKSPHAFLDEERIPLGPLGQLALERG